MPDAIDWLIEYVDLDKRTVYHKLASLDDAIPFMHTLLGKGQRPRLYKQVAIALTIDVDPKAPRRRRKTPSPADKPDSATPSGPGNGEAGELKGAASPSSLRVNGREESEVRVADPTAPVIVTIGKEVVPQPPEGAERCPAPSPVSVWACEVDTFAGDPPCPGPILYDPETHGRFCAVHTIPEVSVRAEWHRRNRHRNAPPVAKVA